MRSTLLLLAMVMVTFSCVASVKAGDGCGAGSGCKDAKADQTPKIEAPKVEAPKEDPSKVVVTVGEKKVTLGELDAMILEKMPQMAQLPEEMRQQYLPNIRKQAIDAVVVENLLDAQIKASKITVSDDAVMAKISEISEKNGMTLDQLKERLVQMNKSMDELKKDISKELGYEQLFMSGLGKGVSIKDADVQKYYDANTDKFTQKAQAKASHILIKTEADASDEDKAKAKAQIDEILVKVKAGGDFAAIAKESSACPSSAKGGDLGYFERDKMVKPFSDAAFSMKVGEVSDVVETQFGYHIIKLTDMKEAGKRTFAEAKEEIKSMLESKQRSDATRKYIEALKAKANIVYAEGFEPAAIPNPAG